MTVAANVTTYNATGLSAGTTYYFRVRATNVQRFGQRLRQRHDDLCHERHNQFPTATFRPTRPATKSTRIPGAALTFTRADECHLGRLVHQRQPEHGAAAGSTSGGWEPYGLVDAVSSGSAMPVQRQYCGDRQSAGVELSTPSCITQGSNTTTVAWWAAPRPGAKLTMTTTGINANAVAGNSYTATIVVSNDSPSNTNRQSRPECGVEHSGQWGSRGHRHPGRIGTKCPVDSGHCHLDGGRRPRRPGDPDPGGGQQLP